MTDNGSHEQKSAEKDKGCADKVGNDAQRHFHLYFSSSNVGVHLRRTLCAVMVERIVGFIYHGFYWPRPKIVSAWSVPFVFSVVEGPLCVRSPIFS